MAEHAEHSEYNEEESLIEKIEDKIHFDRFSSSSSDSDTEKKPASAPEAASPSSVKATIWRLFGREKPVHQVFGGGKRTVLYSTLFSTLPIYIILFNNSNLIWLSDCLLSNGLGFRV